MKSFFNEDAQKGIDEFLNDKEVIEAGYAIKHAVSEVISYLQIVSNTTEDIAEEKVSPQDEEVDSPIIQHINIEPTIQDAEDEKVSTMEDDVIVINNDDISQTCIADEPVPCSIM